MSEKKFKKGSQLFSFARKKALSLGIPQKKGMKMADLICSIQEKEGNSPCFQQQDTCSQTICCWQASCGAVMGSN
ncbi:MAG: hypothetical protein BA873_15890 [Desulfobulbaceae bacterium C00003063]|nr:MAG: hypothetical protein BA873_15890 [Desulfobulbaceae bacterium C00003063]